jgi:hypothetical protein
MSATLINELSDQIEKFWSPVFVPELKESAILPNLVSKDYDGQISQGGDTVYVSMVEAATGQIKTIGSGHETFDSEKLTTQRIAIVADKVITVAYELDSLIGLQNQLGAPGGDSAIRASLMKGAELQLNSYLYGLIAPSTSAPDHSIAGVTDFNASQLLANRKLASQAKWPNDGQWWVLADPSYYNDILNAATMTSGDYVGDQPVVGGKVVQRRFGFNILEDNSAAMAKLSPTLAAEDYALTFHKDFMYLVMQQQPVFKLSDLHSNKQHGYLLSVSMVVGAKLGIQGSVKHIKTYNA